MGRGSGVEVMVGRGMVRIWGYRYRYRHRSGTGSVSEIVQHLASSQCVPQNALLLVRGNQTVKTFEYGRSATRWRTEVLDLGSKVVLLMNSCQHNTINMEYRKASRRQYSLPALYMGQQTETTNIPQNCMHNRPPLDAINHIYIPLPVIHQPPLKLIPHPPPTPSLLS